MNKVILLIEVETESDPERTSHAIQQYFIQAEDTCIELFDANDEYNGNVELGSIKVLSSTVVRES